MREEGSISEWQCPVCGKHNSVNLYDPTKFVKDIPIIQKRGLGRGKGFDEVSRKSIFDGNYPELLDLISDRVAVVYDMLYETVEDDEAEEAEGEEEEEESLSELEKELRMGEAEDEEEGDINDLDEEVIE